MTGAVFNRPLPTNALAAGAEQLGVGAEDLASNLAKQQAQQDLQNTKVTLDANGLPQVATPDNSIIMGRAGNQYLAARMAGETSRIQTDVTGQLAQMHIDHAGDPQGFATAAKTLVDGLRSSTVYGPQVANQIADSAARVAEQHQANINEKAFELGTRTSLANIQTGIADTQNQMRVLARQGGMQTPDYDRLQDQLQDKYDQLKGNPLFGYAPDRADSELKTAMSTFQAEDTLGKVDAIFKRTSGDGGRAGAQKMLDEQILNNPDLNLSDPERKQLYSYGMAHLQYLTSDQKAAIDANRGNIEAVEKAYHNPGSPPPPQFVNQVLTQAQSLGDTEGVLRIQAAQAGGQWHSTYAGLTDQQVLSVATHGDYISKMTAQESGGNPNAVNPVTGAAGPHQFIASTWQGLMRTHPELNLTPDGRTDPAQSARAIVAFTNDNKAALSAAGIQPTDANTYMAHFLGASGATSFIKAMQADPSQPAAMINLKAATANPTVFYRPGADGKPDPSQPRSLQEVYQLQTKRFGGGTTPVVAAGVDGLPSQAQVAANPFLISAFLQRKAADDQTIVAAAKNVGNTAAIQLSQGIQTSPEAIASFNQVAAQHPQELAETKAKVQTQIDAANWVDSVMAGGPMDREHFMERVNALEHSGQDLNVIANAQAAMKIYDARAANLKSNPTGEAANRGWVPPAVPLDLSGASTAAPVAQQIAQRSMIAQTIVAHTGEQQSPLAGNDLKTFQQSMPLAPAPVVASTLSALTNLPPAQLDQLGADSGFKSTIMGLAHSGDPVKMNAAYSFLDTQYRRNPMTFQAEDGGKALLELRSWQTLGQFLPPQEVAKRMASAADPSTIKAKEALEKVADKNLESLDASNIVRSVYGTHVPLIGAYVPFTAPGDIASDRPAQATGALQQEYRTAYSDMFKETNDANASDAFAKEKLGNKYSVSALNGGRVMAYAPDREVTDPSGAGQVGAYYPKVNGSFDYLREQLVRDATNTDFFSHLRYEDRNQSAAWARSLSLVPDAKTEADIASKRPPSYQVLGIGSDGRMHLLSGDDGRPMRFRGDPSDAQAKAAAGISARRENAAAVDAAAEPTDNMGGN